MIRFASLQDRVSDYKNTFYSMTHHVYLNKYICQPTVDEQKLFIITAMLSEKLPKKEIKTYALSALLVDAALNTHDLVSQSKIHNDYIKKNRQLTVLAGDYFSSLYYMLLAKSGNLPMIKIYSATIQKINEHKMNVYQNEVIPYSQVKKDVSSIESLLLQNIADYFQLEHWKSVIQEFFFLKRLIFERNEWEQGRKLPIIRSLIHENNAITGKVEKEVITQICNEKIEESKKHLEYLLKNNSTIQSWITQQLNTWIEPARFGEKVAEEG